MNDPEARATTETAAAEQDEVLYLSQHTRVFRRRLPDGERVICKELLGANAMQRFRHESRILERVAGLEGVPRLVPGEFPPCTIAQEDTGAVSLSDLVWYQRLELPALLQLALRLSAILAAVHRRGVAHKNLTPDNILVSGSELRPVLIDFSLATTFAEERPAFVHHQEIAGTLAYLAPEQTGRTGRSVDRRADLYALGGTLYQLATGVRPFEHDEPLQLIHDILAQVPVPPAEVDQRVPRGLSAIIMRLLEKEPDRRYQSAEGVAHDLTRLALALERGDNAPFGLGERDFPLRLSPPSRLLGRDAEVAALRDAFQLALDGTGGGVLVLGAPGVGKTTLINELRPMVTERRGFFAAGKFDQYRRDLASDAVQQALRALGRLLLAEPEAELAALRTQIMSSIGPNAGLVTAMLPEFATLLGAAPEPISDDPLQAGGRLIRAGVDLLRAIASPRRPVVLVLDDLQWATETPIGLVDAVLMDQKLPGLLLVGAYRDDEVDPSHPLYAMRSRWEHLGTGPRLLRLANLQPADLGTLLGEMLRLRPEPAQQLGQAVGARTGGNPYDTVELVNALRRDGVLAPGGDGWSWDAATIRRYVGRGDVVKLLAARIEALPAGARQLLSILACLGGEVGLGLLQQACDLSAAELEEQLAPSLEDGLLVLEQSHAAVRFRHDRVQQAAYGRLEPEARRHLHLGLGRRLAALPEFAAMAAEQYLPVLDAVADPEELRHVVALLSEAAADERVINNQVAQRFLAAALELLTRVAAEADTAQLLALETELHLALYCLGRLGEADTIYRSIEGRVTDVLDLVDAACVQINSLTNRAQPGEAVALGVELLRRLGIPVPQPGQVGAEVEWGLELFYRWVHHHAKVNDSQRRLTDDPRAVAAARIINRLMPAAFFSNQAMMTWLVLESRRLWAEHGPCAALVGPMSHAGFVVIAHRDDYPAAYAVMGHVLAVSEARGYQRETSQARFLFALSASPWLEPHQEGIRQAQLAREGLLRGGDMQQACHTYFASLPLLLESAPRMETWVVEAEAAFAFATRTGNDHAAAYFLIHRQLARSLRGETETPGSFVDGSFDEAAHLAGIGSDAYLAPNFHIYRALSAALFGDTAGLCRHAEAAMPLLPWIPANYTTLLAHLLQALALARRLREAGPRQGPLLLARLADCRAWLAGRSAIAPGNVLHLLMWVDAERAWAEGQRWEAARAFDAALGQMTPRQGGWHRALITERAALLHQEHGLLHTGRQLLAEARQLYEEWGASAKVRQLEREHPFPRAGVTPRCGREHCSVVSADAIDMLAVLRASQALSSETSLERLRAQVVEILGTMTGATAVSLIVWQETARDWFLLPAAQQNPAGDLNAAGDLRGAGDLSAVAESSAEAIPVAEAGAAGRLPLSVFRYAERTRQTLLVEDAKSDDRFSSDPYLSDFERCSLLVVPILHQGAPRAMLMLENRLSRGAFAADRLDAVQLIAGQLAVSLENALLYEKLEERVRQRTLELQEAQSELLATARQAGMAEMASGVLHNVGNVLNSVNISAGLVARQVRASKGEGLARAVRLLQEHARDLAGFLTGDERGKLLPKYLEKLAQALAAEREEMAIELSRLTGSIDHIKDIVATQQSYAGGGSVIEPVQIRDLVDDALRINDGALRRHEVSVVKELAEVPVVPLDKGRVLQILVNLIGNAKSALERVTDRPRQVTLRVEWVQERLRITVTDVGEGIAPENLALIFTHGFTTRKAGHGFGLHSCALAAKEMGGTLTARSEGVGRGAVFTLELPVKMEQKQRGNRSTR